MGSPLAFGSLRGTMGFWGWVLVRPLAWGSLRGKRGAGLRQECETERE